MTVLLDTCTFLRLITGSARLSATARRTCQDPANTIYLSAVSSLEIMVKQSLGRLALPQASKDYIKVQLERHGIEMLSLDESAVLNESRLPWIHGDPFNRMLLCQAIELGCPILTLDEKISQCPVRIIW